LIILLIAHIMLDEEARSREGKERELSDQLDVYLTTYVEKMISHF